VTATGEVRCLKLETGETLWSSGGAEEDRLLKSSIVIFDDWIIISLPSGTVSSLDADSGEVFWKTQLTGKLNTSPVVIGDTLYIGTVEGQIHRMSPKDGKTLGEIRGKSPVYGSLLSAGDCLLALWGEDTLACLDPKSGSVRWRQETDSTWSSFHPLILDEIVVVGTESGELHAFRVKDGATAWTRQLEGDIKGIGSHAGILYVGTVQGRVYAVPL
jgi:outer membrane protein assembly factor BamB